MGHAKDEMMRYEEEEPMRVWIDEEYGDDAGEEGSETWLEAVQAYEKYCERQAQMEYDDYWESELEWLIESKSQIGIFRIQIDSVETILNVNVDANAQFSLFVMLHGHVVAAVEAYLSSVFIHKVTNSEKLIQKLVETDPEFSKMKFTLKEIFQKQESLKLTVATYLNNLIFHKIDKIKPMYKNVLDHDFGDIKWLFEAIELRHHCVHRAGFDKDGNKVILSADSIRILVTSASYLVESIDDKINISPEESDNAFSSYLWFTEN